jgi:hypothetical protein
MPSLTLQNVKPKAGSKKVARMGRVVANKAVGLILALENLKALKNAEKLFGSCKDECGND